ncbi:hypothetical protein TWF694_000259 [Orbilia ellipsospora]|uniref:Uncharacterized protein n=1 Tax=Orbilia ellipsospora TaxID=2528407 RepID=A0AAV9XUQ9_9PEZI
MSTVDLNDIVMEDNGRMSIETLASNGDAISIPWCPNFTSLLKPGLTFHSKLAKTDSPWSAESPFTAESMQYIPLQYCGEQGGLASYRSIETQSSAHTAEHLGVTLGVSVGCKFLNASVTGGYDKDVLENENASKLSIRASYRAGTVILAGRPQLTKEAIWHLRHGGGLPSFKESYGDYYVAGFRIGGDSGLMVSKSSFSKKVIERLSVQVEATALLVTVGKTYEKFFDSASSGSSFSISAFDTLDAMHTRASVDQSLDEIGKLWTTATGKTVKLAQRAEERMQEMGLSGGSIMGQDEVFGVLASSNLIVEILLLPIATLREVVESSYDDGFIALFT